MTERGTVFTLWGHSFDITQAVQGKLGRGLVGSVALIDPTTPRPPSPEEAAALGPFPTPDGPSSENL